MGEWNEIERGACAGFGGRQTLNQQISIGPHAHPSTRPYSHTATLPHSWFPAFLAVIAATIAALWPGAATAQDDSPIRWYASGSPSLSAPAPQPGPPKTGPVAWTARLDPKELHPGEKGLVVVTATLASPWHIYSTTQPEGGPVTTAISLGSPGALRPLGSVREPSPRTTRDEGFRMNVREFDRPVSFGIPVQATSVAAIPQVKVLYQACNATSCMPPARLQVSVDGMISAGPPRPAMESIPPGPPAQPGPEAASASQSRPAPPVQRPDDTGLGRFLLLAFLAGFAALATPCVFPMIPITVSYFTKQEGSGRTSNWSMALVYCLGIVGTFTGLGLVLALAFGASGIARFAANPWVNLGIAAVFLGLALNLMGYFELSMPSTIVNRASAASGRSGWIGALLMGLTFTLTSFTCTVPFVGTLLVTTTQGSWIWPALGMLVFSTAFAFPFFLLALFPGLLARLPRSGAWLVSVKAFMGFLEIAAAVKFLSNADLVWRWHLVTRPVFLACWAIIGISSGMYLFGKIRLGTADPARPGPIRKVVGGLACAAGIYCVAGIAGAPLGVFDAYAPPIGYGFGRSDRGMDTGGVWLNDLDQAKTEARQQGLPIFLDFTGYTCTNCRWMEAKVFPKASVRSGLSQFVRVELYTDGLGPRFERNRDFEQRLFDSVALPLYAVLTPDGRPVSTFSGLTTDVNQFAEWLSKAAAAAR